MKENEKILDKIEKLLNKAKSSKEVGSIAESEAFMAKVRELLVEYNLSLDDIESRKKEEYIRQILKYSELVNINSNDGTTWVKGLINAITKYNMTKFVDMADADGAYIIGTKVNVDICIELIKNMVPVFLNLCKQRFKEYEEEGGKIKKNKFRRDYLFGVVNGIYKKYKEIEEVTMESKSSKEIETTQLLRMTETILNEKVNEFIGKTYTSKPRSKVVTDALSRGERDGKTYEKDKFI